MDFRYLPDTEPRTFGVAYVDVINRHEPLSIMFRNYAQKGPDLSFVTQMIKVVQSCFVQPRQLSRIRLFPSFLF